jgi:N-acetylglutamate synthase-like GNAT family acetyltransferase
MSKVKVGSINTKTTSTTPKPKANIGLRPYFDETDRKYVHYLFYSTYFNLVPRGALIRLKSPIVLGTWIAIFAVLVTWIPAFTTDRFGWPASLKTGLQVVVGIVVLVGGFVSLLWYTDKFDVTYRVLEGVDNDLKETDVYYRGNGKQGNFWVMTLNDEIVGCVGMDQNLEPVIDKSVKKDYVRLSERPRTSDAPEIQTAEWKTVAKVMAKLDDWVRLILVGGGEVVGDIIAKVRGNPESSKKEKILFPAHKPNEASVRRLAIKTECQGHGLSTVLLKRVAFWAHAHQFEYLYAETDELQYKLNDILVKKHGYTFVSKEKVGFFRTKSIYKLDVKLWMSKELERRATEKAEEDQKKEDEELKEYE